MRSEIRQLLKDSIMDGLGSGYVLAAREDATYFERLDILAEESIKCIEKWADFDREPFKKTLKSYPLGLRHDDEVSTTLMLCMASTMMSNPYLERQLAIVESEFGSESVEWERLSDLIHKNQRCAYWVNKLLDERSGNPPMSDEITDEDLEKIRRLGSQLLGHTKFQSH